MDLRVPPRDEIIRHEIGGVLISGNVRPKWRFSIRAKLLDSSNRKSGAGLFCSLAMSNHSCQLRTRGVRASRTSLFIRLNISGGMKVVLAKSRYGSLISFIILPISFAFQGNNSLRFDINTHDGYSQYPQPQNQGHKRIRDPQPPSSFPFRPRTRLTGIYFIHL
jgi:hypothetical protein